MNPSVKQERVMSGQAKKAVPGPIYSDGSESPQKPRQGRPFNSAVPRAPKSAGRRGQARPIYPTGVSPSTAHKCRQAHHQAPAGRPYHSDGRKPVEKPPHKPLTVNHKQKRHLKNPPHLLTYYPHPTVWRQPNIIANLPPCQIPTPSCTSNASSP